MFTIIIGGRAQHLNIMDRFEVFIDNDLFFVYDNEQKKYVSKGYKYSKYAHNLQSELEIKNIYNQ